MYSKKSLVLIMLAIMFESCDEPTLESDRALLDVQRQEIIVFAKLGKCMDDSQCGLRGLGSKPCGGPWEYIVYSTSIDTQRLFQMITRYNQNEDAYNRKWGIPSDCSLAPFPDSVGCLNGVCVKYRDGVVY